MHGGTKCIVVQNAWWYEMHGSTKCMVVRNAWCAEFAQNKTKTTLNTVWIRLNHARTRRGRH